LKREDKSASKSKLMKAYSMALEGLLGARLFFLRN